MKALYCFLLCLCMGILSGCATIVSDNKSFVKIESEPTGSACELVGENFHQTITTPATLLIPAKASPVRISCAKEGYFPAVETIESSMDGTILGNILFGGIIGVAIDAANKSGYKYQERVGFSLYKKNFVTRAEKDSYFEQRITFLNNETQEKKDKLGKRYSKEDSLYIRALKKIDKYHEKRLAELTKAQEQAQIGQEQEKIPEQKNIIVPKK